MDKENFESIGLIDGLHSTPSRRYLSDTPISEEIIWNIIDAAIRGPSGGNRQGWAWMVIRDKSTKTEIAYWYLKNWTKAYGIRREQILSGTDDDALGPKNFLSADHLANHIQDAPVWIIPVLRNVAGSQDPRIGSSIYGAVQNLMLAARAYGIGSTLTALHSANETQIKNLLNLPDDALTMAIIPLGYPVKGRWSQPKRKSVEEVTHWEYWNVSKVRVIH